MRQLRRSILLVLVALVLMSTRGGPTMPFVLAAGAAAGAQEPDTDGDTMPDAWETFFGLNPNDPGDATGDLDGDGLTNAQEFAAGRHPNGLFARYFAEGSTGYFNTSVGLLNLSETETAHVAIALLIQSGGVVSHRLTLAPRARQTVSINDVLGVSAAVSIVVESDVPVAADRWMTWGTSGIGASLDSGAPAPATTWYFAEGATGPFLLYYLFENPGMSPATVTIRYLVEGAPPVTTTHTLPPQSRTTVPVNQEDPSLAVASVGSVITSTAPIFAERAMYVNAGGALGGGSASAGSNQLSTQWYFGEGSTGPFFQCFLSMLNPGSTAATATVTYHMSDGSTASKAYPVPAGGRRTVYFNGEAESDPALAALAHGPVWFTVSSTQPILGERAMWWFQWPWYEGHSATGNTTSATSWAVPEGRDGGETREQTYVLIGNTTTTAGQVRLTLIPDTGAASTRDVPIAAGERLTLNIGNLFGLTEGRFSVIVDSLGTTPVPLAVDYARYRSVNGVPFSGGGAAPAVPITGLGDTAPSVTSTTPAANATGVAVDTNLTVTFSEPVNAGAGAFVLECPAATPVTLTNLTVSPATTFTLEPAADLPISTACTLRIVAGQITDADTIDPPDSLVADVTVPFTTSACAAITVGPTTVPGGTANVAYAPVTFTQTGGIAPVSWNLTAGALPGGMSLSAAGVLAGTPTASGSFTFTATVTGANACTGSAPRTLSILAGPNQAPSFTAGPNKTSLEDAGPQAAAWATAISPGPSPDESGQAVTFNVTGNTNAALFSLAPAISPAGVLTYTTASNTNGTATITVQLQDNGGTAGGGVDTSAPQSFTITVTAVNDAPGFTAGANQTVAEDAGPQSVANWATAIGAGPADEAGQTLTFNVTNNTNAALFSAGPSVSSTGTLTYTPAVNAAGTATITLTLQDNGGAANGGLDTSAPQSFTVTITPVNDAPSFTVGANQTAPEDSGLQTVAGWATAISAGPPNETGQALTFNVTGNTNAALFSTAPAVSPAGTLTYAPAPNALGTATITLTLSDDGGGAGGGVDTSAPQTFTITVTSVNDAPSFTAGANQSVPEDAGPQSVAAWATAISAGPANEAGQTLTFNVTGNTNATLFSAGPSVSPTGTLTYMSAPNAFGTATITLVAQDNGGTANGGVDTSVPRTFTITVTPVNDAPLLTNPTITYSTVGNTQLHVQGATLPGVVSVSDASGVLLKSAPTDIDGPVLPAVVPLTNFDTGEGTLTISADGSFTYVPDAGFTGTDTFTVQVTDTVTPVTLTVQVTVGELVWYVNGQTGPNNPAGGDGRSTDAWETLAAAQAGAGPNSTIFVFDGISATTAYAGGIALQTGQKLLGEGVGLTIAGFPALVPAGTRPRIVATNDAVTVVANTANGNRTGVEIRGLNLISTTGNAVEASSANTQNLGVRISENTVTTSAVDGIIVPAASTGTATLAIHDNTITAGGNGLQIARTAGTVFITAFQNNVVSGNTVGSGIVVTGPSVFFDAVPGGALDAVAGGATVIGTPGNGVGVAGMVLTSVSGALAFTDLDIVSGNGAALSVVGTGAFTGAAGTSITAAAGLGGLAATGGPAAALSDLTTDLQLGGLSSANSTGNGVSLTNVSGTFTAPATATITNATNADFNVSGGAATITYNGTITDDVGALVSISGTTGGTKSFAGAITDGNDGDGNGISLTSNTGATITFSGGLVLSTGANPAFTATGGGTVNVCDENPCNPAAGALVNTITTTTGTALNVANTTIGASGMTFRSISANGGTKGISLNNTGAGAFTVSGTGTAGSGGTIQNASNRGGEFISVASVTLNHMVFDNNGTGASSVNCGDALGATGNGGFVTDAGCISNIHLQTVPTAVLNTVTAKNSDGHGINAYQVGNLTLTNVSVERNGNEVGEDGVQIVNTTGTVSVGGASTFRDNAANQFEAQNATGSPTFNISGAFFGLTNFPTTGAAEAPSPGSTTANSGLLISGNGTANMTVAVSGSTFEENFANGYLSDTAGGATMNITLGAVGSGNTFRDNGVPIEIVDAATGSLTYTIRSNTITNATATTGIFATTAIVAARSGAGSPMTGMIDGNVIGTPGVINSGCFVSLCDGISLPDSATSNTNVYHVTVTNNTINHVQGGITSNIGGGAGSPRTSFVITGNTLGNPDSAGVPLQNNNGILINSGTLPAGTPQTCVEVSGNSMSGNWGLAFNDDSIRYRHRGAAGSEFRVRNFTTGGDIDAFVTGINTAGAGTVDLFGFQLVGANVFTGGAAACP